jgi:hypothetical protein
MYVYLEGGDNLRLLAKLALPLRRNGFWDGVGDSFILMCGGYIYNCTRRGLYAIASCLFVGLQVCISGGEIGRM